MKLKIHMAMLTICSIDPFCSIDWATPQLAVRAET